MKRTRPTTTQEQREQVRQVREALAAMLRRPEDHARPVAARITTPRKDRA